MRLLWGLGGMLVLLLIALAASSDRRAIRPRTVFGALLIQVVFAVVVLRSDIGQRVLEGASSGVQSLIESAQEGVDFLVGPLNPGDGSVVAFTVLPSIVFVAAVSAILYHWNVLQWVVRLIGGGLRKVLGTTRPESLNATANIFLGQTEAPLLIRPYLKRMTDSEFFAVMVGGLSTVSGGVLVGYALLGARVEHLIAASFMAAPAALMFAKILVPETETPARAAERSAGGERSESTGRDASGEAPKEVDEAVPEKPRNVIDAAAQGASDGMRLAINVAAMLLVFVGLIALINLILGGVGGWFGAPDLTLQRILGYIFSPIMFVIGVPWHEAIHAASYVGEKVVLNEFVAFTDFGPHIGEFSPKTAAITTFALTGFANVGSLGILLGGLGGIVPSKRSLIAKYGMRAILAATLANLMSAAIAGVLVQ